MSVSPVLLLQARAEARALLYHCSEFDLDEALAPLLEYGIKSGLCEEFGAEAVLAIIKKAFSGSADL